MSKRKMKNVFGESFSKGKIKYWGGERKVYLTRTAWVSNRDVDGRYCAKRGQEIYCVHTRSLVYIFYRVGMPDNNHSSYSRIGQARTK